MYKVEKPPEAIHSGHFMVSRLDDDEENNNERDDTSSQGDEAAAVNVEIDIDNPATVINETGYPVDTTITSIKNEQVTSWNDLDRPRTKTQQQYIKYYASRERSDDGTTIYVSQPSIPSSSSSSNVIVPPQPSQPNLTNSNHHQPRHLTPRTVPTSASSTIASVMNASASRASITSSTSTSSSTLASASTSAAASTSVSVSTSTSTPTSGSVSVSRSATRSTPIVTSAPPVATITNRKPRQTQVTALGATDLFGSFNSSLSDVCARGNFVAGGVQQTQIRAASAVTLAAAAAVSSATSQSYQLLNPTHSNVISSLQQTIHANQHQPHIFIDATLTKLLECMSLYYSSKLTSPKWKSFKGSNLRLKKKIRLNNLIWRAWFMQYICGKRPPGCQFIAPVDPDVHKKSETIVLEGKYWKRKVDAVLHEYSKWRRFYKQKKVINYFRPSSFDWDSRVSNLTTSNYDCNFYSDYEMNNSYVTEDLPPVAEDIRESYYGAGCMPFDIQITPFSNQLLQCVSNPQTHPPPQIPLAAPISSSSQSETATIQQQPQNTQQQLPATQPQQLTLSSQPSLSQQSIPISLPTQKPQQQVQVPQPQSQLPMTQQQIPQQSQRQQQLHSHFQQQQLQRQQNSSMQPQLLQLQTAQQSSHSNLPQSQQHQSQIHQQPPAMTPSSHTSTVASPMSQDSPGMFTPTHPGLTGGRYEQRRACHINAEQKRRCNIKNGFDTLKAILPSINQSANVKISKAAMLQKAAQYINTLDGERNQQSQEAYLLKQEIEVLKQDITRYQCELPASGAPVGRQDYDKAREMFDEYVRRRTLEDWKFWIFSLLIEPLFNSYYSAVSTNSLEEAFKTIIMWLSHSCSLMSLRRNAIESLTFLSTSTNILSMPQALPNEAMDAVSSKQQALQQQQQQQQQQHQQQQNQQSQHQQLHHHHQHQIQHQQQLQIQLQQQPHHLVAQQHIAADCRGGSSNVGGGGGVSASGGRRSSSQCISPSDNMNVRRVW